MDEDDPHLEDSPSSEQSPVATPAKASTSESAHRMNPPAVKHKNAGADLVDGTTKKKVSRMPGGGLRQFSVMVCKKLESKGSTTYAEVADEIIEEFARTNRAGSLDEFHEKNVRRRVYDALNVLMAMDIITREKKEIRWKGLSTTQTQDLEELKALHIQLMARIAKKAAYLKDLEEQIAGLQNIIERNQQLLKNNTAPKEGFTLPFILVQTSSNATVEIEISEDMQLVHLDFNRQVHFILPWKICNIYFFYLFFKNDFYHSSLSFSCHCFILMDSTPFCLHDDAYVLKLMRYYQQPKSRIISQSSSIYSSSSSCKASGVSKPFYWNSDRYYQMKVYQEDE
ncbi:hypothetical protein DITRI_Ditri06bG0073300 [Diplodiscus trichospermus]